MFHGTGSIIAFYVGSTYPDILILHLADLADDGCLQVRLFRDRTEIQSFIGIEAVLRQLSTGVLLHPRG